MRAIVCGGRDFDDSVMAYRYLDMLHAIHGFEGLIVGGARGADTLAENWAYMRMVPYRRFPAQWKIYGNRRAGPIRNQQMLDQGPDMVIAFKGGSGTAHMKRIAESAGVRVIDLNIEGVRLDVIRAHRELDEDHGGRRCGGNSSP
jgi:hypothetical protein